VTVAGSCADGESIGRGRRLRRKQGLNRSRRAAHHWQLDLAKPYARHLALKRSVDDEHAVRRIEPRSVNGWRLALRERGRTAQHGHTHEHFYKIGASHKGLPPLGPLTAKAGPIAQFLTEQQLRGIAPWSHVPISSSRFQDRGLSQFETPVSF
jgi:hypothetical protein